MKLFIVLAVFCACVCAWAGVITENGRAKAEIICASDATAPERNAALELQKYIRKISGAALPVTETASAGVYGIYVGQTEAVKRLTGGFDWQSLAGDGILIRSDKNSLILAGDRPRGALYAVYAFLEDFLGVRFLTPSAEKVPENKTIRVRDGINYTHVPPFFSREAFFKPYSADPAFAVKRRVNGHFNDIDGSWGGHVSLLGWAHTFGWFVPGEKYFAAHPEWFSLINGTRSADNTQLCLSNDECVKALGDGVLEVLRKEKAPPAIISVTQNDNGAYCQCENCAALAEKYGGTQSGLILHAVNQVADRVKEEFPEVKVETFAYWYSVDAPKNIKPRDNVIVRLCNIRNNFGTPLYESAKRPGDENQQTNLSFVKSLKEWSRLTDNLFIWNYIVDFSNYYIIHPNFHCLKPDLKCFREYHAKAIFEQGDNYNMTPCFNALKGYLTSRLLWDPDIDDDAVIKEFLQDYYGAAAPYLYNVIDRCEKEVAKNDVYLSCYMPNLGWLPDEAYIYCFENFNKALAAVSGDDALKERVIGELLSFQWGWYLLDEDSRENIRAAGCLLWDDEKEYERFFYKWAYGHGNGYMREGGLFEHRDFDRGAELQKRGPRPEEAADDEGWFEVAGDDFELFHQGRCSFLEDDPAATTGKAAGLNYNSTEWAIQRRLSKALKKASDAGYKSADIYITLRRKGALTAPADAEGCNVLIFDTAANTVRFSAAVKAGDIQNGYTTVKLGSYPITKNRSVYLAVYPRPDSALGEALLTDRVYFVLKK